MAKVQNNSQAKATVTSIDTLKSYQAGELVQLPNFGEGQEFWARLKRPSMLALAKSGKIPNTLLDSASKLFQNGVNEKAMSQMDEGAMSKVYDVMDIILEASFVEPTYKDLQENGIELTDEQMMFVFGYSQVGVKQVESFREQ